MRILVTGSSGLIGSEVVSYFDLLGWEVHGIDNNMRADFFGPAGDTRWNQRRLQANCQRFRHHELDIRDRGEVLKCAGEVRPDAVVHALRAWLRRSRLSPRATTCYPSIWPRHSRTEVQPS